MQKEAQEAEAKKREAGTRCCFFNVGLGERSRIRGAKHLFYTRFGWFVHPPWVGFFVLLYPTRPSVPSHYSDFLIPFVFHPFVLLFTLHV